MPWGVPYDPKTHCRTCRGWGTFRAIGSPRETTCPLCKGTGTKEYLPNAAQRREALANLTRMGVEAGVYFDD